MKNYIIILIILWGGFTHSFAQNSKVMVTVTGRVTNEQKEPLIGVSVIVKNEPGLGVTTNNNGEFTIKMEQYQWLVFSYVGSETQEVLIKDKLKLDIVLKDSEYNIMNEVAITALGPQKKVTLTGAVTSVDLSTLKTPTGSLSNALAGNVAGVMAMQSNGQPGNNTSEFWIRGISTFGAGTAALVLVDGFERDFNEVNIEDIESFSVLKDASTTAIYGSRGANGVVLITTKRGKDDKISINSKVEGSYNTRTYTPEFVDGYTYASLMNEARTTRNEENFYSDDDLGLIRSGLDPDLFSDVDWMDMFLKDGAYTKRASLNMSGGSKIARFYVSGSYIDEESMYATNEALEGYKLNSNYRRWNYRTNVDMNLTKSTLVKIGISGSLAKQNLPGGLYSEIWSSLMGQNPISIPVLYSDGRIPSRNGSSLANPWVLITQQGYIENWDNKIQTNITLDQDLNFITDGLRFTGRFGFDTNNHNNIRRLKWPETWEAERLRDSDGNLVYRRTVEEQLLRQTSSANGDRSEALQAELHYNKSIEDHQLGGILQYAQDKKANTSFIDKELIQGIDRRNQRLAGRFTYGYKYRYFIDLNFGYNGSENFARGHQFDLFPAVSGAWNIAEEAFIKDKVNWMDMLKVRYSYGKVGNDYIGDDLKAIRFPYLASFTDKPETGYNWGDIESSNNYNGLTYNNIASNTVTWEVATKHDLGLDFSFLKDKITGALDYFHEQRDGIYMVRDYVPSSVGLQSKPSANIGSTLSKGFDGQLKVSQKINQVNFTLRSTITYSKNEILEADEQFSNYPYINTTGFRVKQNRGLLALGLFKDYEDIRNSPTQTFGRVMPGDIKYKDINGDGKIDNNDIVPVGAAPYPSLIYGFGLSTQWKNFDVSFHFQGAGNSSFFINGFNVYPFSKGDHGNILKDVAEGNRWILDENEDINATYPRLSYGSNANNYRASSYWLRESSYLRLKTLEAGYTLPKNVLNRLHLKSLRLYFLGTNLLTFTNFKLWDPEMNSSNGQAYPLSKTFTFGLITNL